TSADKHIRSDFGLAAIAETQGLTATGLIMGSPEYMAPEQVAGKRVDERADIYALGVVLYEIFTGRVPFTGESAISVGFQQLKDNPPAPSTFNPQIPPDIESIILKALQKDPFSRYRSVTELKEALEAVFAAGAGVVRQPASAVQESERVRE
ncbi:MAG TPA: protein kinase, partial [Acidobacteriota bacterium]|nr:protein kinase [Acidobacteriota bacterium]